MCVQRQEQIREAKAADRVAAKHTAAEVEKRIGAAVGVAVEAVREECERRVREERERGDRLFREVKRLKEQHEHVRDWAEGVVLGREHRGQEEVIELREKFRSLNER